MIKKHCDVCDAITESKDFVRFTSYRNGRRKLTLQVTEERREVDVCMDCILAVFFADRTQELVSNAIALQQMGIESEGDAL